MPSKERGHMGNTHRSHRVQHTEKFDADRQAQQFLFWQFGPFWSVEQLTQPGNERARLCRSTREAVHVQFDRQHFGLGLTVL
ncbi:Glyoxylase or a related metal-dependent hydrolase [Pseudomonas syringae pv. actinidiae]|uniref:Glyoxylase or a related metal-dependent hydrolase n=1 Tax=Pseudomonas syringae pv. actinidiae TaxID=103796 RepID=A0AAN4TMM5_PSESF|nr:Glyoxylase or a related metal-dependent hydrolase [Pseudomonas syringae pv. actinidiae]